MFVVDQMKHLGVILYHEVTEKQWPDEHTASQV